MTFQGYRRTLSVGTIAAAALLIAGCGSSSSHVSSPATASHKSASGASAQGTIGGAAISRAADISGAEKGEKISYTLAETVPSLGKITLTGTGAFNASPASGQMVMNVSVPGAAALGAEGSLLSDLQLQLVIANNKDFYIKLPGNLSALASTLTGGKPWLEVDLTKLAAGSNISGLSSLLNGQSSPTDPAATLKQLEAASDNGVTKVGTADVNGVETTEYKGDLDLSKLSSSLPASLRASMKKELGQTTKTLGLTSIPIDVYIDSAHLIRRVDLSFTPTAAGTKIPVSLQMDFLAYGAQPAPTVPAAGETFNIDGLIGKLASGGASSLLGG